MNVIADDDILAREIGSWKGFDWYALRQPNATLFNKMLTECLKNEEARLRPFKSKGPQVSAESLFMILIFQQQKMISKLIEKIQNSRKKKK